MRIRPFFPIVPALAFLPVMAMAAEGATADIGGGLLQLLFGFALVLGLLFAAVWLLKKLSMPRGGAGNMVHVVSAAAVGPRERVVLVDVGGKRLVLGVAPGQVSLLDTQDAPAEPAPRENPAAATTFAHWLKKNLAQRDGK